MLDPLFWWTGALVWAMVSLLVLWLLGELVWAAIAAASWTRFAWVAARGQGAKLLPTLLETPLVFLARWRGFIGFRPGSTRFHGEHGYWNGIGQWAVTRPAPSPTPPQTPAQSSDGTSPTEH